MTLKRKTQFLGPVPSSDVNHIEISFYDCTLACANSRRADPSPFHPTSTEANMERLVFRVSVAISKPKSWRLRTHSKSKPLRKMLIPLCASITPSIPLSIPQRPVLPPI